MPLRAWRPDVVEVPNCAVAVDARAQLACYPRGSFYPLSFGLVLVSIVRYAHGIDTNMRMNTNDTNEPRMIFVSLA